MKSSYPKYPKTPFRHWRHFEDPKTPLRHTGSFTLPLRGSQLILRVDCNWKWWCLKGWSWKLQTHATPHEGRILAIWQSRKKLKIFDFQNIPSRELLRTKENSRQFKWIATWAGWHAEVLGSWVVRKKVIREMGNLEDDGADSCGCWQVAGGRWNHKTQHMKFKWQIKVDSKKGISYCHIILFRWPLICFFNDLQVVTLDATLVASQAILLLSRYWHVVDVFAIGVRNSKLAMGIFWGRFWPTIPLLKTNLTLENYQFSIGNTCSTSSNGGCFIVMLVLVGVSW